MSETIDSTLGTALHPMGNVSIACRVPVVVGSSDSDDNTLSDTRRHGHPDHQNVAHTSPPRLTKKQSTRSLRTLGVAEEYLRVSMINKLRVRVFRRAAAASSTTLSLCPLSRYHV